MPSTRKEGGYLCIQMVLSVPTERGWGAAAEQLGVLNPGTEVLHVAEEEHVFSPRYLLAFIIIGPQLWAMLHNKAILFTLGVIESYVSSKQQGSVREVVHCSVHRLNATRGAS